MYSISKSNIELNSDNIYIKQLGSDALYARDNSNILINGNSSTQIIGDVHSYNSSKILINSEPKSDSQLTYIQGNIKVCDSEMTIGNNEYKNYKTALLGNIILQNENESLLPTLNIDFGSSGLFKGRAFKENGISNLNFDENSVWYMTGDSTITTLNAKSSLIDMTAEAAKDTILNVDSLVSDNAMLLMDAIASAGEVSNDRVKVASNASGNVFIHVPSTGKGDGKTDSGILVETPTGQSSSYTLASPKLSNDGTNTPVIDLGVYNYELKTEDKDGKTVTYLTPYVSKTTDFDDPTTEPEEPNHNSGEPELSPSANAVLALAGAGSQTSQFLYSLSDLRKRMGDVRNIVADGLYAGIRGGKDRISGFASTSFKNEYYALSVGYDRKISPEWIIGANFENIEGDQSVKCNGYRASGEDSTQSLKTYATWFNDKGDYADFVVGFNRFKQDINTNMLDGTEVFGNYHSFGFGASVELGKKVLLSNDRSWFLEPQTQLSYFHVYGEDFTLSNGMRVSQDNVNSLTGRLGVVFGRTVLNDDGTGFQLSMKAGLNHEFWGDADIQVNGVAFTDNSLGTRGYYGVALDWYASDSVRVFGQVEREEGAHFTSEINARLGIKYQF